MNYIREAEKIMKDYAKLKDSLTNLNSRKNVVAMRGVPEDTKGIDYDKVSTSRVVYSNDTINDICEMTQINKNIKETEAELKLVEDILKQIKKVDPVSEQFLKLRFTDGDNNSLKDVAVKMGYSEDSNHTIYNIKEKAMREFAIRYFGVSAQKYT